MIRRRLILFALAMPLIVVLGAALTDLAWPLRQAERTRMLADPRSLGSRSPAVACRSCHQEHFEEWTRSAHGQSLSSPDFARSFATYVNEHGAADADPRALMACLACHAPALRDSAPEKAREVAAAVIAGRTDEVERFGVDCAACHPQEARSLSAALSGGEAPAPHASKRAETSLARSAVCAGCHAWAPGTVFCSDVYTVWKETRAAREGVSCRDCHMPRSDNGAVREAGATSKHSHAFPGSRSPAMLRRAVALQIQPAFRKDRLEVLATVRNLTPHRVPDG